ncbi:MAG TPA: aminotransferase class I/II-fold pyridoxal phosphate-dependent enzyme [Steroidobacteraceae bacterium]|nr:aminotransferase class I/II-fold pyridoxal phosphate-dependent enzyme [Gammaproteobacteria bacterium]HEV2285210.1 aminotransferase class I/II-fold pyridoxal phosphate-dependent enzyme [Steroidobacteraceae bacterium]
MKKPTRVNHPPPVELPPGNRPLVAPIYQSVKFEFEDLSATEQFLRGERPGFFYTRSGNPTNRQLERLLAELQGREDCLVTASGIGAIAQALLALTKSGDHILTFIESYNPARHLMRRLLARFGVRHTLLSIADTAGIERVLGSEPVRLVYFESPTNPITRIADIAALTRAARAAGALTVMDNTFAGFHQHGEFEVDVFVHSLTKYASGAGDVLGGAVIARAELIRAMHGDFGVLGGTLDPHAAFLILRGLKSYFVRYRAQCASALAIAQLLAAHPAVTRVHYPGLPAHPQHALAARQMRDFGTIVSFDLEGGEPASRRFADALELFALTPSLGSGESLVVTAHIMGARDLDAAQRAVSGVTPGTVRLSLGLEDVDDLIEDVTRALAAAGS